MGTRSKTYIYETFGDPADHCRDNMVANIYKQYDGYPEGWGEQLIDFMNTGTMVNGIPFGDNRVLFNGAGDLAAQIIAKFKEGSGGMYMAASLPEDDGWEDFEYHIYAGENGICMECLTAYKEKTPVFEWKQGQMLHEVLPEEEEDDG